MDEVLVGVEESGGVEKRNGRLRPEKRVKKKGEGEPEEGDYTLETEGEGRGTKGSKQQRGIRPQSLLDNATVNPSLTHLKVGVFERKAIIKTSISTAEI